MQRYWGLILCTALALVSPVRADGVSGTYVAGSANSAILLQVVQTADGQLTGRYEQVVLQNGGKVARMVASVTGASDGHTIVVIKPTGLLSGSITASGVVDGSIVRLSGGGYGSNLDLVFAKAEEMKFQESALVEQARVQEELQCKAMRSRNSMPDLKICPKGWEHSYPRSMPSSLNFPDRTALSPNYRN